MKVHPADLIVLGAGCAGLSIARELALAGLASSKIPKVLLLESEAATSIRKTWCYWEKNTQTDNPMVSNRWPVWSFSSEAGGCTHRSRDWHYACIPSVNFYRAALQSIGECPSIDIQYGLSANEVHSTPEGIIVQTDKGPFICNHLIDTRPPANEELLSSKLLQVFLGYEIQTTEPIKDLERVGLMESMTTDSRGFRFDYVLPLNPDRLLIELTRFCAEPLTQEQLTRDIEEALQRRFPTGNFIVQKMEYGIIPMGLTQKSQPKDPRWVYAGTRAGAVRPASGYAFAEIQEWARSCAKNLIEKGAPLPHPPRPRIVKAMDHLFLDVLAHRPDLGPHLFLSMAKRLDPSVFARFMAGKCSSSELFKVVYSLPFKPFLIRLLQVFKSSLGLQRTITQTP